MTVRRTTEEVDEYGHQATVVDQTNDHHEDAAVAGSEEVVETHADGSEVVRGVFRTVAALVGVATVALLTLLAFRFGFLMAGANPTNGFVDFIYDASDWLVDPFEGIASTSRVGDDGIFDPATLIAMAVVVAVGMLIIMVLWALTSIPSTGQRYSASRTQHSTRAVHDK